MRLNHEWRKANPFRSTCTRAKARAKKKGIAFNLTPEYLESIDRQECPYLEIPIRFSEGGRGEGITIPDGKSLDRIDSCQGYVEGNVVWCSQAANNLLSNYTATQLLAIPLLHRVGINFLRLLNSTKPTENG